MRTAYHPGGEGTGQRVAPGNREDEPKGAQSGMGRAGPEKGGGQGRQKCPVMETIHIVPPIEPCQPGPGHPGP